ncbi:VanW family protein [Bacillus massilinigeriensis]|uniref:VanW family protein n=1 Tax=Bacillus mediterraneensis TaxID=1805474 RepID=UPI0008F8FA25|nr:VanW family protein [Bacillus mediterraneensis]
METRKRRKSKLRKTALVLFVLAGTVFALVFLISGMAKEDVGKSKSASLDRKEKDIQTKDKREKKEKPIFVDIIDPNTKNVVMTFEPKKMGYGTNDESFRGEIIKWARTAARGTDTNPGYDQRNTLDRIDANGNIVKGKPRVILEEKELAEKVIEASAKGGKVQLPLYVTASNYKPGDAAHLNEVVVASYTTKYNSNVYGRSKNIELSAKAIDNVIIGIDDYFSFNTTVGPSDEAHGYQPAEEAVNGKLVMGIGGGICQTSSTLFNAIDQLGVEYVEKHHHSVNVGYVPKGRDATVSFGGVDFRFKNTTGTPLLIRSIFGNGTLTIEIRTSKIYQDAVKKRL